MTVSPKRRLRRLLRRAARHPRLAPLAWHVRAWRRARMASPSGSKVADRRARIAVPPGIRAVEAELEGFAVRAGPIVAGPWHGTIAWELLYWIPFLRWFRRRFDVDRSRLAAVSRPGAALWYADVCASTSTTEKGAPRSRLGPGLLETVCRDYWEERGPLVHVLDRLVYERILISRGVPDRETIVYWPEEGDDRTHPWLDLGGESLSVLEPGDRASAATLTTAISGARLLVGPWSGRLLLGPLLGVPTLGLTDASSPSPHLDLAQRAARALESRLLLVDRSQMDLAAGLARKVAA